MRTVVPDRKRRKVCTACGFVYFAGPKLVAGCLVVEHGRVLLLRRGIEPSRGRWTFPGGYVDADETVKTAAVRETSEEVGISARLGQVLGVYVDPANPAVCVVVYLAERTGGSAGVSDEALEVRYFAPDEVPWDDLAFPTTRDALTDWVSAVKRLS